MEKSIIKKISIFFIASLLAFKFPVTILANEKMSGQVLTKEDFIVKTEKPTDELLKYDNNVMDILEALGESSYEMFFMSDNADWITDLGQVTFNRDIVLGVSTREDLIKAYGIGIEFKFNSSTDLAFSGENYPEEYRSIMKEIEKNLKESIVYNYKDLYQIIFFIDNENIVQVVYFLNEIYYTASKEDVSYVQTILNSIGYNCGTPDGIVGSNTKKAILQYQKDNGLFASGEVDDELLKSLGKMNIETEEDSYGISLSQFVQRYNEAIDYYNAIAERDGYNKAGHITEDTLKAFDDYAPSGNMKITVNPNTTNKNPVGIINVWAEDNTTIDANVSTGEIMATLYAFDTSMSEGSEALELWKKLNETPEVQQNGITYNNYSFGGMIALKAQYDGFEIQK